MVSKTKNNLPKPYECLMITYNCIVSSGPYGDTKTKTVITKRGFYCSVFETFSIPPEYRIFGGVMLPHGWGGHHLKPNQIIDWKYYDERGKD